LKPAFTASEMVAGKFTLEDLKVAGYSASELKSAGYTVSDLKLLTSDTHLSNEPFKELYSDTFASGVHVRGPVKHVDRAISKAYRSYFGNFRRLTDIVRCSIVLNTTADIQEFVKVHRVLCAFESACSSFLQKIVSNSWIRPTKMTKAQLMKVKPLLNFKQLPVTGLLQQRRASLFTSFHRKSIPAYFPTPQSIFRSLRGANCSRCSCCDDFKSTFWVWFLCTLRTKNTQPLTTNLDMPLSYCAFVTGLDHQIQSVDTGIST